MMAEDSIVVAQHLENLGVDIVRGGFASWIREDLGFAASDEHVERALGRVRAIVAGGRPTTMHDLTVSIAAEMPLHPSIDAFGGSAWNMD
jgi:hypothetical protein